MGSHVIVIEVVGQMVKCEQRQCEHDGAGQEAGIVAQPLEKRRKRFLMLDLRQTRRSDWVRRRRSLRYRIDSVDGTFIT